MAPALPQRPHLRSCACHEGARGSVVHPAVVSVPHQGRDGEAQQKRPHQSASQTRRGAGHGLDPHPEEPMTYRRAGRPDEEDVLDEQHEQRPELPEAGMPQQPPGDEQA